MRDTLKSLLLRVKKYLILLIIVPVVTAIIAFFLADNVKLPSTNIYTANVKIELGNFNYPKLTEATTVKTFLTSTVFLEDALPDTITLSTEEFKRNMKVSIDEANESNTIEIELIGTNEKETLEHLNIIINKLMSMSNEQYQERVNLISSTIEMVEEETISAEEKVEHHQFLYSLKESMNTTIPTEIIEPINVGNSSSTSVVQFSPFKKAIFGFLLGILFNILFIFIPEVFQNNRDAKA
jgi:teichuronic acid biosynthesis protein TuaF